MYRTIMVPLDGSPFSEQALPFARNIARWAEATVDAVHVHTLPTMTFSNGIPIVLEEEDVRRSNELAYLRRHAQRLVCDPDQTMTVTLLDGPIADALAAHAVDIKADLVVMTTHGRGMMSRFWLGSVADTLVHKIPMPLLLVRPTETLAHAPRDPTFTHVLIPLDGSALAEHILDYAIGLGSLTNARYTLLQVIDPTAVTYASPPAAVRADERLVKCLRADAQSYLDCIAERLRQRSLEVDTEIMLGTPAPAILTFAHEQRVDLIAMGTHGRGGLSRLLLGSVADKVVRGACAPVLLHRPQAKFA